MHRESQGHLERDQLYIKKQVIPPLVFGIQFDTKEQDSYWIRKF